jgi:hypothetical protein
MHVIAGLGAGGAESMLTALSVAKAQSGAVPIVVSLTPGGTNGTNARRRRAGAPVWHDVPLVGIGGLGAACGVDPAVGAGRGVGGMYHANLVVSVAVALSGRHRQTKVYWGIRGSNMDLSGYGLALRLAEDDFVIEVAARYDPMKDYPTLLAALEQIPAARAIIMEAGTAVALPESPQLRVLGRHDNVLGTADVPVSSPTYGVGFSNAIAEAMATGLLVVAAHRWRCGPNCAAP